MLFEPNNLWTYLGLSGIWTCSLLFDLLQLCHIRAARFLLQLLLSSWHGIFAHILMTVTVCLPSVSLSLSVTICLSLLSVSQLAPHWASVSGFVIKKSHQSQQRADWMPQPCHAPLRHDALSFICCQHYQRVDSTPPPPLLDLSCHTIPLGWLRISIECPITAPKSFPFRFHCKTNVMSVVAQLISPPLHTPPPPLHTSPDYSHSPLRVCARLMRLMKKVLIVLTLVSQSTRQS